MAALPEKTQESEAIEGADRGVAEPNGQSVRPSSKEIKAPQAKGGAPGGAGVAGGKKKKGKR